MDPFSIGPLLTKLLAGAGAILAAFLAWKANGALQRKAGAQKLREQQEIERARIRIEQASVPRPADADVVGKLRRGGF